MHSNSTDAELLARAVEEPVLFAALFERHGQAVRRYAIRRIGEAGDDVTSEVFVRAFRGPATAPIMTRRCRGCSASPTT
jgi:DNA-directed RNA polymerase specialized sigma24 family protein